MISEAAAQAAGLCVGDSIPLSFYWGANPQEVYDPAWKLGAQAYSQKVGFLDEAENFEIVGIYRQSNLCGLEENFHFLPNTVFVPNAALPEPGYTKREDVFFSYILQNGRVEALKEALQGQGFPDGRDRRKTRASKRHDILFPVRGMERKRRGKHLRKQTGR